MLQSIGLDAEFWRGEESFLYPRSWLTHAAKVAEALKGHRRYGRAIGVDSGQGRDKTCWCVVDELGIIELIAKTTKDTTQIPSQTLFLMQKYQVQACDVYFDIGGGGHNNADQVDKLVKHHKNKKLRGLVERVPFGTSVTDPSMYYGMSPQQRQQLADSRAQWKNRRAEMYGLLQQQLDPTLNPNGFAIAEEYTELRRQLSLMPYLLDGEGKMFLPPKDPRPNSKDENLRQILGCSPDESDALVLANYGLFRSKNRFKVGILARG